MGATAEMRMAWAPPCSKHLGTMRVAYQALDAVFHKHNYQPRSGVTGSYNCRRITGGTGYSLHAYLDGEVFTFFNGVRVTMALAVDVNWNTNPYGPRLVTDMPRAMVDEIMAIRTNDGAKVWGWGGYYSGNKDAMHYEIVVSPSELATGIRGTVVVPPTIPDKVLPMFSPPHRLQPIVDAQSAPEGGAILLGEDGSIYAYGGASFFAGANGQPWFAGRRAARLDYVGDPAAPAAGRRWQITAHTGETYHLP